MLAGISSVLLLVGYQARLQTVLLWIHTLSLHNRNPLLVGPGDHLHRLLLFWSMFLPLEGSFSITSNPRSPFSSAQNRISQFFGPKAQYFSLGSVAILIQICEIHLTNGLTQTDPEWVDGKAFYYLLSLQYHSKLLGSYLLSYPALLNILTQFWHYLQVYISVGLLIPFWTGPLRGITSCVLVLSYLFVGSLIDIGILRWMGVLSGILCFPGWVWEKLIPAAFLPLAELDELQQEISYRIQKYSYLNNVITLWRHIKADSKPSDSDRDSLKSNKPKKKEHQPKSTTRPSFGSILLFVILVFITVWNMGLIQRHQYLPASAVWIGYSLRLDQPGT
jgi:hypothetical protein